MKPSRTLENAPEARPVGLDLVADETAPSGLGKLIVLLGVGIVLLSLVHLTPVGSELHDLQKIRDRLDGSGIRNEMIFFVAASVLIAAGVPRLLFFALAGLLFGFFEGCAAALAASMAGSFVSFRAVRWGGREWVTTRFGGRKFFRRITSIQPTALSVFLVRQLPISNVFINATLALSSVRNRAFLLGSLLGFLPQGAVAALIGSGATDESAWEGLVQLGLAAVAMSGFSFWVWKRRQARKEMADRENPT